MEAACAKSSVKLFLNMSYAIYIHFIRPHSDTSRIWVPSVPMWIALPSTCVVQPLFALLI